MPSGLAFSTIAGETTARTAIKHYEQRGHGSQTLAEAARQPVFLQGNSLLPARLLQLHDPASTIRRCNEEPYNSDYEPLTHPTTEKHNDLRGPELTKAGDIVPRCACAIDTEAGDQRPYDAKQGPSSCICGSGELSDSDSDLAPVKRQCVKTRLLV